MCLSQTVTAMDEKQEKEFEIYRARDMRMFESDFDLAVKQLIQNSMK